LPGAYGLLGCIEQGIEAGQVLYYDGNLCYPCRLVGAPSVRAIEDAVFTGLVRRGFYFNRIKDETIPDICCKYADTFLINPVSRVYCFIEYDV